MSARPFAIVCAVDLGESSSLVVENALAEARRHDRATLHFLHVLADRKEAEAAENTLRNLVTELLPAFADGSSEAERKLRFHIREGEVAEEIIELAMEARAQRIFIARHGGSPDKKEMGNNAALVVTRAPCTVQVVQVASYEDESEAQCADCVAAREESAGERWFCARHSEGRIPRLSDTVGLSAPTPGWGLF